MSILSRLSRRFAATIPTTQSAPPQIESLESRALLSADIVVAVVPPLPSSAISGEIANKRIGINIANNGPDRLHGLGTLTLFASLDGVLGNDDAQITTRNFPLNIPAGRNHTYRLNVHTFPQNLNGNYFIIGQVSGANATATTQGTSVSAVTILPAQIDLAATLVKAPRTGHVGRKIGVSVDVTNAGNVSAKGSLAVAFSLSANSDGSNPFAIGSLSRRIVLRAGHHTVLHFAVPLAAGVQSGNQYVVADVDPSNLFSDPNLGNNTMVSLTPVGIV